MVVDEDVDTSELCSGGVGNLLAVLDGGEVRGEEVAFAAGFFDPAFGLLGVFLFVREICYHAIGSFHSEQDGYCAANA